MNKTLSPLMLKQIKSFWRWFVENENQIKTEFIKNSKQSELFNLLDKKIGYVSKRIGYTILSIQTNPQKLKLTITAHGYRKLFPKVNGLIDNSPYLKDWEFLAFIKPNTDLDIYKEGRDFPFVYFDAKVKISEMFFKPIEFNANTKKMKIEVYVKNYNEHENTLNFKNLVNIILIDLIGEINYKRNISYVKISKLPSNPINLIHLHELFEYVDFLNKINRRVKIEI